VNHLFLTLSTFSNVSDADKDDMQSMKHVFTESVAAWNRGDMDGYLNCYADLPTVRLISGGKITIGKDAIATSFKARFPSPELMGMLTTKNLEIERLTAVDALFYGEFHLERDEVIFSGVFTGHLKKFSDGWAIVLDHSSALE
jgi:ketosteroid isomerase-like protein